MQNVQRYMSDFHYALTTFPSIFVVSLWDKTGQNNLYLKLAILCQIHKHHLVYFLRDNSVYCLQVKFIFQKDLQIWEGCMQYARQKLFSKASGFSPLNHSIANWNLYFAGL